MLTLRVGDEFCSKYSSLLNYVVERHVPINFFAIGICILNMALLNSSL